MCRGRMRAARSRKSSSLCECEDEKEVCVRVLKVCEEVCVVCVRERERERRPGAWESVPGQYKVSHNVNVMYNTYLWRVRARRRGRGVGVAVQMGELIFGK